MVTVDERLSKVEVAVAQLVELNANFAQSNANHRAHIAALERRADAMERRADTMEQNIEELARFNRQTRRLWIIVARKSNLLDDDDIKKWLKEDL